MHHAYTRRHQATNTCPLACAGGAVQQHAALLAQQGGAVQLGVLHGGDDIAGDVCDDLPQPSHILKGHFDVLRVDHRLGNHLHMGSRAEGGGGRPGGESKQWQRRRRPAGKRRRPTTRPVSRAVALQAEIHGEL